MFCSSLRKRSEWASAIPLLSGSTPRLQGAGKSASSWDWEHSLTATIEGRLNTHDIALPLPQQQGRVLRLVLLSPKDIGTAATEQRLERLFNLNGGQDAFILFLLNQQGHDTNPTVAFMNLQIDILSKLDIPLVPLTSISSLPSALANLRTAFAAAQPATSPAQATSVSPPLLQHLASGNGPLSEHMTNLLSELGQSPREIAGLAETAQGKARILGLLGPVDGARVLSFLAQEKLVFA